MKTDISALIPTYWVRYLPKRRMPQPESFRLRRLSTNIAKKRRIVKEKVNRGEQKKTSFNSPLSAPGHQRSGPAGTHVPVRFKGPLRGVGRNGRGHSSFHIEGISFLDQLLTSVK